MQTLRRIRSVLGIRDGLLVVGFLAANTFVEVSLDVIGTLWGEVLWALVLLAGAGIIAWRSGSRAGRPIAGDIDGDGIADAFGVRGDLLLGKRRGAVVLVGLESDKDSSALARLLVRATELEYLALIGTHETHELGVDARIQSRLLPATGHSLPANNVRYWPDNQALSVSDHVESTREAIEWLRRHGVRDDEIIVDITAGRRMAGFGALRAADAQHVEAQYLAYRWDHMLHQPIVETPSFRIVSAHHHGSDAATCRDGLVVPIGSKDPDGGGLGTAA